MPSFWDKVRGSRRKGKIRSRSVNDTSEEDEFVSSIRKRESFIETTKTDWVEVSVPKTQSLGRGMKLESSKKSKSATLDVGFSFKRKSEWKPKVTDIEEIKVKTKAKKDENKKEKNEVKKDVKIDKKKDKRKSRDVDFENAQLERGESVVVGRKMVLWRGDRKRHSQFDMEPVSTVDQWAACSKTVSPPASLTPGSPCSTSVHTPGSMNASLGSLTVPSPQDLGPSIESGEASGHNEYQRFQSEQGPYDLPRPVSFHEPGPELVPPSKSALRVDVHLTGATPEPGPVLRSPKSPCGPILHFPIKMKKKSISKDSIQSPTFESRSVVRGPAELKPPSRIPKPKGSQNKTNGAPISPTSPPIIEGPILTPPANAMARQSQDSKSVDNLKCTQELAFTVSEADDVQWDAIAVESKSVETAVTPCNSHPSANPDVTENAQVDLHSSLDHGLPVDSETNNNKKDAKEVLNELLERTAPPVNHCDVIPESIELSAETSLNNSLLDQMVDSIEMQAEINAVDEGQVEEDHSSSEARSLLAGDADTVGSLVTSDSIVIVDVDEVSKIADHKELGDSVTEPFHTTNVLIVSKNIASNRLEVEPSMNGNWDISPSGAGDTLANTNGDEFYINSSKYYDDNLEENGMFEMELNESRATNKIELVKDNETDLKHDDRQSVEIQIQIPEKLPPRTLKNIELASPQSPSRPMKPICLVAYPRRLVNLSPCERCSRSIDSVLGGLDDLDSPILEQDVHDWVLVDKDFESPKLSKRKMDKKVQTDFQNPIDIKKPRVCSSNSSSLAEMRISLERNSCTLEDLDYDDYVVPAQLLRVSEAHYRISGQCSESEFELFGQISPFGQSCGSPLEEEPKKSSKPPVSQIKGHQPDLVSNSIGSRAHAAQEISRLEALCEARTKELRFAKMQVKSASQGFDAMSVIVQYLTTEMNALQTPELNKRLINAEKKIIGLLSELEELRNEKARIESTMHDLIQSHKEATEAMKADHRAQVGAAEERAYKRHEDDIQKIIDQHSEEVKTLKAYHEKKLKEMEDRHERLTEDSRKKHSRQLKDLAESDERHLSELQKQHEIKLEEITKRFEEIKCTLHDKVYSLKAECDELRNRSQMYEEALQRDTDFQVHNKETDTPKSPATENSRSFPKVGGRGRGISDGSRRSYIDAANSAYRECLESLKQFDKELALAPYRDLPQEIDSLRTVVEMKNAEIHELRQSKADLERQLEELPNAREKIITLEQKIENLEAIVSMKQEYEKQLVEKHQQLLRRYDKETKANKRLSMDNEELMYKLNETEDFLLSPSPERMRVSPVTTPDMMARRGFCRSPHDSTVVTRRQRTSSTSSSDDKRSSTISMRSEEERPS